MEYYKQYSLKEGFSSLDTTLQVPYRELSDENMPRAITKAGSGESASQTSRFSDCDYLSDRWQCSSAQISKFKVILSISF